MNNKITWIALWIFLPAFILSAVAQGTDVMPTPPPLGLLHVHILVPQKKGCTDSFMIYPYPVRPPTNEKKLTPLPKTMKDFRLQLFSSGYSNRVNPGKVYPTPGWRWRYIFQTAVEKSKMPLPNNVVSAYAWVDAIMPYALPELRKVKAAERMRIVRYNKAVEFWDLNNVDMENQATMESRRSYELTINTKNWVGRARLPVGTWWVVGVHKLPSLIFYWQEPVKVTQSGITYLNLDEWNALVVQGGW